MPSNIKRAYVAGPMTGYPEWNVPAFKVAAKRLRAAGIPCICPHEIIEQSDELAWADYLRADLKVLVDCDAIVLLHNWHRSRGALVEAMVAYFCGLRFFSFTAAGELMHFSGASLAPSIFTAVKARLLKV